MKNRKSGDWKDWVRNKGVPAGAREMGLSRQAVYNWLSGNHDINRHHMKALIELSDNELSWDDFF